MLKKITIGLLIALLLDACNKSPEVATPPRPALVMIVGENVAGDSDLIALVGEVKSRYESSQGFRIAGKIIERKAEVGDVVKKGQLLARIDPTDSELSAKAANADIMVAQANYNLAKADVERQRQLLAKKFISASALDAQEALLKTAAARLKQAKAEAVVANNQSQYTSLTADRNGVLAAIHAEPGQVVQAGEIIAKIVDRQHIEVKAAVPESRMNQVKLNDMVMIRMWANPEKLYKGKIRVISPEASDATRAFDVWVTIINPDDAVRLGMTAGVIFAPETAQKIIVPSSAVTQYQEQDIVWVIDEKGIAERRSVEIGPFTEKGIAINRGLSAGEMVAIAGVHTLVQGQQVKPAIQKK